MHEYQKIKRHIFEILSPLSFSEVKPDTELDVYGSMHCIYANANKRFMVEWHGEDGYGSVEEWHGERWQRLKSIVPEGTELEFNRAVEVLCDELRSLI